MRTKLVIGLLTGSASILLAETACCGGENPSKKVFRDAPTHESLMAQRRAAEAAAAERPRPDVNPAALPRAVEPVAPNPNLPAQPQSLFARSEVLHARGVVTLVPKQSVLHLPEGLKGSLGMIEGAKLVVWGDFYINNRSWIDTVEVTRSQAEGREPLDEKVVESFKKSSKMVVATYQGGPISVLPLKVAPETEENVAEASNQIPR